jgi:hypothetical protein
MVEERLLNHKLWEYGIDDVGKPSVLNLNAKVAGTLSGEFQFGFNFQSEKLSYFLLYKKHN